MAEPSNIAPLTLDERVLALVELSGWEYDQCRRAFYRMIRLTDFAEAVGLMMRIAVEAEKADHHPEWTNVYNRLEIWLTTHDAGDVSQRDIELARIINSFVPNGETTEMGGTLRM